MYLTVVFVEAWFSQIQSQILRELLAIVFACDYFQACVCGREEVHIDTDHKPLESTMKKPSNNAPTRLQQMLLTLQRYDLVVIYKKGTTILLADTLVVHIYLV